MAKARTISVNLQAGTAKFFTDLDAASGKIKQFGQHGVSSVQATSGALRVMEGNFTNNIRAVERFIATTLGMGSALQAAFPLIGGIAFGGLLVDLGQKAYKFWKDMQDGPEKMAGAFRALNNSTRLTNDELAITNDRLENEIAKLEGRHENTLKLALDAAKKSADDLADSLDRDLAALYKLLEEQDKGFWKGLFNAGRTDDLTKELGGEAGFGGYRGRIDKITDEGNDRIQKSSDPKAALAKMYSDILAENAKMLATLREQRAALEEQTKPHTIMTGGAYGDPHPVQVPGTDKSGDIERFDAAIRQLQYEAANVKGKAKNATLEDKLTGLKTDRDNAQLEKPFDDRMKMMGAQIDAVRAKLAAIGQPESAQLIAKAFGDAQKAIVETDKALERHNTHLSDGQKALIRLAEQTIVNAEAEAEWRTKMTASEASIEDRIRSQNLLTAAIGKGYEATRQANIETRLMQELGQHFNDPKWMAAHQSDVTKLRTGFGREFDAQHSQQSGQALDKLNDQIQLERELAQAQAQGAEAVRQATLAAKLRQIALDNDAESAKKLMAAEIALYNAQRGNATAVEIAKIEERIAATGRLAAALLGGAEAERKAALETKYAAMRRQGGTLLPGVAGTAGATVEEQKERQADELDHQRDVVVEALRVGMAYQDQYQRLAEQKAVLEAILANNKDNLAAKIALQDVENQTLRLLTQETLQLGSARNGVQAFFLEMQMSAKKSSEIIYEALNSALDRTSENLAKMLTGQKTEWGKAFKDIGFQMVQSSVKSELQKGLAAVGGRFAPAGKVADALGLNKKDGSTESLAFWVRLAGIGLPQPAATGAAAAAGAARGGSASRGKLDLGGLFGGGSKDGLIYSLLGYGGARAEGGGVEPGTAYTINEKDQEYFIPDQRGTVVPHPSSSMGSGGGDNHYYSIDARGTDPVQTEMRVRQALIAVHGSAIATSLQASQDRIRRVPASSYDPATA